MNNICAIPKLKSHHFVPKGKIKRNKHLKYISLCGMNVYIIQVSLFEWN